MGWRMGGLFVDQDFKPDTDRRFKVSPYTDPDPQSH
jgi:hypothetical protein